MNKSKNIFKCAVLTYFGQELKTKGAPINAEKEIYFGYNLPDKDMGDVAYMHSHKKKYDLNDINIEYDLFATTVEASKKKHFFIYDINKTKAKKISFIGDTHHGMYPLSILLRYFSQERYDALYVFAQLHHMHFFYELGYTQSYLYPNVIQSSAGSYVKENKDCHIVYVGNMQSPLHYRTTRMCKFLRKKNINNQLVLNFYPRCDYEKWMDIISRSEISICSSLNGQFTLQIYSIMGAGSLCLVDRISKQTGVYDFFVDGRDFVTWENFDDLWEKLNYYSNHLEEARKIAKSGSEKAIKYFSYRDNRPRIYQSVMFDNIDDKYRATQDLRCCNLKSPNNEHLIRRVRFYETMQEIHRVYERLSVLFFKMKDISSAIDVADLPRLDIDIVPISVSGNTNGKEVLDLLVKNGVDSQINLLMQPNKRYDVICVEVGEINDFRNELSVVKSLMKKTTLLWIFGYLSPPNRKIIRKAGFREHKLCELNYDFRAFAGKVFNKLFKIVLPPTKIITPVSKIDGVSGWKLSRR
jgi:hypothetical protein